MVKFDLKLIEEKKNNVSEEQIKKYKGGMDYNIAENKLNELLKTDSIMKSDEGIIAAFSGNSMRKLLSEEAVNKSKINGFTRRQHYAAASDIKNLFKNSVKILERPDRDGNPDIKAIHRLAAPLFGDNIAYIVAP